MNQLARTAVEMVVTPRHHHRLEALGESGVIRRFVDSDELTDEERRRFVEILEGVWGSDPPWKQVGSDASGADYLDWESVDYPGEHFWELLELDGRLIGMQLHRYMDYRVRGNLRRTREGTLWAIDPSTQGRGIATAQHLATRGQRDADSDFLYDSAVPSHPTTVHLLEKYPQPWQDQYVANGLQILFRPLNLRRFLQGSEAPADATSGSTRVAIEAAAGIKPRPTAVRMAWWGNQMLRARIRPHRRPGRRSDIRLRTVMQFDDRVTALLDMVAPTFDVLQSRTPELLNWRYCDPRAGHFTVRVAEDGDRLLGYLVSKNNRGAQIADLLVLPGRLDVAAALLEDMIERSRAEGAHSVRFWVPRAHPYAELARSVFGFIPQRNAGGGQWAAWGATEGEFTFFTDPRARLHKMMGDGPHV